MRPVIHRIKHVVDLQTAIPVNTQIPNTVIKASDTPDLASVTEVETGAKVSSFFCTVECVASETSTTATPNIYMMFVKNPGGIYATFPNANAVGSSNKKRFVIHQEMVMINPLDGGNPRNIFKGVIKIPKGYQRMAPDDELEMHVFIPSTGVAVNLCAQFHYKEFR